MVELTVFQGVGTSVAFGINFSSDLQYFSFSLIDDAHTLVLSIAAASGILASLEKPTINFFS